MPPGIIKMPCRNCAADTNHAIKHSETINGDDPETIGAWSDEYNFVRCLGCDAVSLRNVFTLLRVGHERIAYYPPRASRREPRWISDLDPTLADLLEQIYVAINNDLRRLVAMGVRAAMEYVMINKVGDQRTFANNVKAFTAAGYIAPRQADILTTILDVGSATIHRAYNPTPEDVEAVLDVAESVIAGVYVDGPRVDAMKTRIPPAPPPPPRGPAKSSTP